MMFRYLYTLLFYLALPLVLLRLLWRAIKAPSYAARWSERFGFGPSLPRSTLHAPRIWVHVVSVGETLAALPMMRQLQKLGYELVVTTMTPTGSERVKAALGDSVHHVYAPYDLPDALNRFLVRTQPQLAIILETELWPNTLAACAHRGVPVLVANARLSEKSARGYQRFARGSLEMMSHIQCVAAQSDADAERFMRIGLPAERCVVTGNIKFDLQFDASVTSQSDQIRQLWQAKGHRLVWLAASTHQGEDEVILKAYEHLRQKFPSLLLVLVPRHPERFDSVTLMAEKTGRVQRHSLQLPIKAATQIVIGDTMGELMALLGAADVVLMGGTLVDNGGHNLIEPAAWGKPIVCGPSLFNFAQVSRLLEQANGLRVIDDGPGLIAAMSEILASPELRQSMGTSAKAVAQANRGALDYLLIEVNRLLPIDVKSD